MPRRTLLLALVLALALPAPAFAGAGFVASDPGTAISRWTPERREAAEPLPLVTLAGSPPSTTAAVGGGGVDAGDPTVFPNRANGVVYGEFVTAAGRERYQCSGSVIDSGPGDLVLTAGHCVIDPETGTAATSLVFVPGYREGATPYGVWGVSRYVATDEWAASAGGPDPDEAGDLAFLVVADDGAGSSVEDKVGALGIAFDQPREQTYTQWGYPAEGPYDGETLYSNTAAYAGGDPSYSPAPMRIASDFTGGASGGPWTVTVGGVPTVLSLTDYTYEESPHSIYGAYLGAAARHAYEVATGEAAPTVPVETGGGSPLPVASTTAVETAAGAGGGAGVASGGAGTSSLRIASVLREPARGTVTLAVEVGGAGSLRLSGPAVRTVSLSAPAAGTYRLKIAPTGSAAARALRRRGSATVGVWLRFGGPTGVRQLSRLVRLERRSPARRSG